MLRFSRTAVLCLMLAASLIASCRLNAAELDPDNAMLFDIRLDELRMGDGARGYDTSSGICVEFADVASALDVAVTIAPDRGSAKGWVFDEHSLLEVDRTRSIVKVRGRTEPLVVGTVSDSIEGWCVLTTALADWFGVSIETDTLNALLKVNSDLPLPAQRARSRSAAASLLDAREKSQVADSSADIRTVAVPYSFWRTPSFDISTQVGKSDQSFESRYEIALAGEALWMSLDAHIISSAQARPQILRTRFYRSDPDARLLSFLRATEFALGDVTTLGSRLASQSATGRGISLTNRPLGNSSQFDMTSFQGELALGWDVELFRNGELIGVARGNNEGRFRFLNIPLLYGSNLFEIIRHGPQGQLRRERHIYEVGPSAVPSGTLWWNADLVQERHDLFTIAPTDFSQVGWRYDLAAEFGLNQRTSIAASLHTFSKKSEQNNIFEAEVRRAVGASTVTLTGAANLRKGHALSLSGLGRLAGIRFSFSSIFNRALSSDLINKEVRRSHVVTLDRDVSVGGLLMPLHFDLGAVRRSDGGKIRNLGVRTSITTSGFNTTVTARASRTSLPGQPYGPIEGGVGLLVSGRVGRLVLRGDLNYRLAEHCSFSDARLTGQWSWSDNASWQAGIGYNWDSRQANFDLGYSRNFRRFVLSATGSASSSGAISALAGFRFSLGPDSRGRLRQVTSPGLAANGMFDVTIFKDENGDGIRQSDEQIEIGAGIQIAGVPAKVAGSEQRSFLSLHGLAPASPAFIGVNPKSLPDPLLNPLEKAVRVIPRKGLVFQLDLAVAAYGIIEGVSYSADREIAPGIDVVLLDSRGTEVMRTKSDFDGSFVFEKVRFGQYLIKLENGFAGFQSFPVVLNSDAPFVRKPLTMDALAKTIELSQLKK